jgi:bifunctional non-homologous end joining protein LigD
MDSAFANGRFLVHRRVCESMVIPSARHPEQNAAGGGDTAMDKQQSKLGNPDKVLFPDAGISKRDLAHYYAAVADPLLAHAKGRPLTLRRFPDGIAAEGFFQQHHPGDLPDGLPPLPAPTANGREDILHITVASNAGLVALADLAAIELHGWLARAPELRRPDRLIFDLDPPDGDFAVVRDAARRVADLMDELGLAPHLMTTGSRGLHVVAPLVPTLDFDAVRALAKDMAERLTERHPDDFTTAQRKDKRGGRLYLDVMRNAYGQTAILPYSPRAKPGAPVATPLDWDELRGLDGAQAYDTRSIPRRLAQKADPWADIDAAATSPEALRAALQG